MEMERELAEALADEVLLVGDDRINGDDRRHAAGHEPDAQAAGLGVPILPLPFPVSGSYIADSTPSSGPARPPVGVPLPFPRREELRLDVDGRYPQMVASGTLTSGLAFQVHWIADLTPAGRDAWTGPITYKDGFSAAAAVHGRQDQGVAHAACRSCAGRR